MSTDYINAAQQRLLQLIDLLAGHELQGLAPSEIAKALSCTAPMVTRDMANLQAAGWAEKTPKGDGFRFKVEIWTDNEAGEKKTIGVAEVDVGTGAEMTA